MAQPITHSAQKRSSTGLARSPLSLSGSCPGELDRSSPLYALLISSIPQLLGMQIITAFPVSVETRHFHLMLFPADFYMLGAGVGHRRCDTKSRLESLRSTEFLHCEIIQFYLM